jgi:hypothetical protein
MVFHVYILRSLCDGISRMPAAQDADGRKGQIRLRLFEWRAHGLPQGGGGMTLVHCEARNAALRLAAVVWALCAASGCANFHVDSDPPGDCYFNGQFVGKTPYSAVYSAAELQGARCALVLPGHSISEASQLPPAPNAIPMESAPPGALVYFNEKLAGKSPLYRTDPGLLTNLGYVAGGCRIRVVFPPEVLAGRADEGRSPPAGSGEPGAAKGSVTCDLRVIGVADGSGIASASGQASASKLDALAKALAVKLKEGVAVKGEALAVISLRNRSGSARGKIVVDELADKVQGALIDTGWFEVKERIDLRGLLTEQDLDTAGVVRNEDVRKRLAGVKYIVIGGVTVTEPMKP